MIQLKQKRTKQPKLILNYNIKNKQIEIKGKLSKLKSYTRTNNTLRDSVGRKNINLWAHLSAYLVAKKPSQ